MQWSCVGVGVGQGAYRRGKTTGWEFFETVVFWKSARRTHCGNGAQRGEREVGGGCLRMDIMGNGSVQQVRSERECQYGRAGRLATGAQASEDRGLVAAMTEIDPRLMSVGRAVGGREPAWILKTG